MAKWRKKKCFHNLHIALARMYLATYLPTDGSLLHFFQWEWISPWRRHRKVVWKTNSARPGKNWVMCREKFVNRLRYFKFSVSSRGTPRSMPSRTSVVSRGAEWDSPWVTDSSRPMHGRREWAKSECFEINNIFHILILFNKRNETNNLIRRVGETSATYCTTCIREVRVGI